MNKLLHNNGYGIRADDEYFVNTPKLEMPAQESDKVVTLNNQGFMRVELDNFSRLWIKYASENKLPCLEIGAAYGQASIAALELGGTIIANDISPEHLIILRNRVDSSLHKRLFLNNSSFPEELELLNNSIGHVLFCRLGHFFTNETLIRCFNIIYECLALKGRLFYVGISPYHYTLRDRFLPIFLKRKVNNEKNSGYIDNMREYIPRSFDKIPMFMNCFDEDTFTNLIKETNFIIKEITLFDYRRNNSNGKGFLGVELIK